MLILQHTRERGHAFNTARIVQRALVSGHLAAGYPSELDDRDLGIRPGAALLYPAADARPLSEFSTSSASKGQLVIIDGTWHHAKTLVRDVRALRELPRYQLLPSKPGQYRIRREPNEFALSTLEATVAALRIIEPETDGLDQLLATFERMVQRQVDYRDQVDAQWRRKTRDTVHQKQRVNIPRTLRDKIADTVVAYGESAVGRPTGRRSQTPIYWLAKRLGDQATFAATIDAPCQMSDAFLAHLQLPASHFAHGISVDAFRARWQSFLRPRDTLVVYNPGVTRMLDHIDAMFTPHLLLKSIQFRKDRTFNSLDELIATEGLTASPPEFPGRAGQRLANAEALAWHLHRLASG